MSEAVELFAVIDNSGGVTILGFGLNWSVDGDVLVLSTVRFILLSMPRSLDFRKKSSPGNPGTPRVETFAEDADEVGTFCGLDEVPMELPGIDLIAPGI